MTDQQQLQSTQAVLSEITSDNSTLYSKYKEHLSTILENSETEQKRTFIHHTIKHFQYTPSVNCLGVGIHFRDHIQTDVYDIETKGDVSKIVASLKQCKTYSHGTEVKDYFFSSCGYKLEGDYKTAFEIYLGTKPHPEDAAMAFMLLNPVKGDCTFLAKEGIYTVSGELEINKITPVPIFSQALFQYWGLNFIVSKKRHQIFSIPGALSVANTKVIFTKYGTDVISSSRYHVKKANLDGYQISDQYVSGVYNIFKKAAFMKIKDIKFQQHELLEKKYLKDNSIDIEDHYSVTSNLGCIMFVPFPVQSTIASKHITIYSQNKAYDLKPIFSGTKVIYKLEKGLLLVFDGSESKLCKYEKKGIKKWVQLLMNIEKSHVHVKQIYYHMLRLSRRFLWLWKILEVIREFYELLEKMAKKIIVGDTIKTADIWKKFKINVKNIITSKIAGSAALIFCIPQVTAATDQEALSILAKNHPFVSTFLLCICLAILFAVTIPIIKLLHYVFSKCTYCVKKRQKNKIKQFEKKYDVCVKTDQSNGANLDGKWVYAFKEGRKVLIKKEMLSRPLPLNISSGLLLPWVFIMICTLTQARTYNHIIGSTNDYATINGSLELTIIDAYINYDCSEYAKLYKNLPQTVTLNGCQAGKKDICGGGYCDDPRDVLEVDTATCSVSTTPIHECFYQKKCKYVGCVDQYYNTNTAFKCVRKNIQVNIVLNGQEDRIISNTSSNFVYYNNKKIGYQINADQAIDTSVMAINNMLFKDSSAFMLINDFPKVEYINGDTIINKKPQIINNICTLQYPDVSQFNISSNLKYYLTGSIVFELEDVSDIVTPSTVDKCLINSCVVNTTDYLSSTIYCILERSICKIDMYVDDKFFQTYDMLTNHDYSIVYYTDISMKLCSKNCVLVNNEKKIMNNTQYCDTTEETYVDTMSTWEIVLLVSFIILMCIVTLFVLYVLYRCCCTKKVKISGRGDLLKPTLEILDQGDYYIIDPKTITGCAEFSIALYTKLKFGRATFIQLDDIYDNFIKYCKSNCIYYSDDIKKINQIGIYVTECNDHFHAQLYVHKNMFTKYDKKDFNLISEQIMNSYFVEKVEIPVALYLMLPFMYSFEIKRYIEEFESMSSFFFNPVPFQYRKFIPWLGYDFSKYYENLDKYKVKYETLDKISVDYLNKQVGGILYDNVHLENLPFKFIKEQLMIHNFKSEKYFLATIHHPLTLLNNYPLKYDFNSAVKMFPQLRLLKNNYVIPRDIKEVLEICESNFLSFQSINPDHFLTPLILKTQQNISYPEYTFNINVAYMNKHVQFLNNHNMIQVKLNVPVHNWSNGRQDVCWAGPFASIISADKLTLREIKNFYNILGINVFIYDSKTNTFRGDCVFDLAVFIYDYGDHVSTSYIYQVTFNRIYTIQSSRIIITKLLPINMKVEKINHPVHIPTVNVDKNKNLIKKYMCSDAKIVNIPKTLCKYSVNQYYIYDEITNHVGTFHTDKGVAEYRWNYEIILNSNVYTFMYPIKTYISEGIIKCKDSGSIIEFGNDFILTINHNTTKEIKGEDLNRAYDDYLEKGYVTTGMDITMFKDIMKNGNFKELGVLIDDSDVPDEGNIEYMDLQQFTDFKNKKITNQEIHDIAKDIEVEEVKFTEVTQVETQQSAIINEDIELDINILNEDKDNYRINNLTFPKIENGKFLISEKCPPLKKKILEYFNNCNHHHIMPFYSFDDTQSKIVNFRPLTHRDVIQKKQKYNENKMNNSCYAFATHNFIKYLNDFLGSEQLKYPFFDFGFLDGKQKNIYDYWDKIGFPKYGESQRYYVTPDVTYEIDANLICAIIRPNTPEPTKGDNAGHFKFIWKFDNKWYECDQFPTKSKSRSIYTREYKKKQHDLILLSFKNKIFNDDTTSDWADNESIIQPKGNQPFNSFIFYYSQVQFRDTCDNFPKFRNLLDWRLFNLLNSPVKLTSANPMSFDVFSEKEKQMLDNHSNMMFPELVRQVNADATIYNNMLEMIKNRGLFLSGPPEEIIQILDYFGYTGVDKEYYISTGIKLINQSKQEEHISINQEDSPTTDSGCTDEIDKPQEDSNEDSVQTSDIANVEKVDQQTPPDVQHEKSIVNVTPIDESKIGKKDKKVKKYFLPYPKYEENPKGKYVQKDKFYYVPVLSNNAMLSSVKGYLQARNCKVGDTIDDTQGHINTHAINMFHKFTVICDIIKYINNIGDWEGRIIDINDSGTDYDIFQAANIPVLKFRCGYRDYYTESPLLSTYHSRPDDIVIFTDCTYYKEYYDLFRKLNVSRKYVIATYYENYDGSFSEFDIEQNGTRVFIHGEGNYWSTARTNMDNILRKVKTIQTFSWGPMTMFCGVFNEFYNMVHKPFLPLHIASIVGPSTTIKSDIAKSSSEMNRGYLTTSESRYFTALYERMNLQSRKYYVMQQKSVSLSGFLGKFSEQFVDPSILIMVQASLASKTYRSRFMSVIETITNITKGAKLLTIAESILNVLQQPTDYDKEVATQICRNSQSYAQPLVEIYTDKNKKDVTSTIITAEYVAHYSLKYEIKNMITFFNIKHVQISGIIEKIRNIAVVLYGLMKEKCLNIQNILLLCEFIETVEYAGSETKLKAIMKDYLHIVINHGSFEKNFLNNKFEDKVVVVNTEDIKKTDIEATGYTVEPKIKQTLFQSFANKFITEISAPTTTKSIWNFLASANTAKLPEDVICYTPYDIIIKGRKKFDIYNAITNYINKYNAQEYIPKSGMEGDDIKLNISLPFIVKKGVVYCLPEIKFDDNVTFKYKDYFTWRYLFDIFKSNIVNIELIKGLIINNYDTVSYEQINTDEITIHKKLFDSVIYNYHVTTSAPNDIAHAYEQRFTSYILPDSEIIKDFDKFMDSQISKMIPTILQKIDEQHITVEDYIAHLSSDKKREAEATYNLVKDNPYYRVEKLFHLIPKADEQMIADESKVPRVIMAPDKTKKLLVGYYSYIIESALIDTMDEFMIGKTGLDMLERFKFLMNQSFKCFSLDGKSFDGHQHVELIRAVDNKFVTICKMLDAPEWFTNNVEVLANEHHRCYVMNRPLYKLYSNKRAMKMYNFIGKTPSGHAFHTTVMNTFRSVMYMKYTAFKAHINIYPFAAGDDTIVFIKKEDTDKFVSAIKKNFMFYDDIKLHNIRSDFTYGLGQVLKEFKDLPTPVFCSMVFNYNFVVKNFDNAIKRNLTWSTEPTEDILFARYLAFTSWHLCEEIEAAFANYFGISEKEKNRLPKDVAERLVKELHYTPVSLGTQEFDIGVLEQNELELVNFISNYSVVKRDEMMHTNRHDYLLYELYDNSLFLDMPSQQQFQSMQKRAWRKQLAYDSSTFWY